MAKDELPRRDRSGAADRMRERREGDTRVTDRQGFKVIDPNRDRPSHPDGWQTGGRDGE